MAVQWLGFCAFTAEGLGSFPGQGTKILQAKVAVFFYSMCNISVSLQILTGLFLSIYKHTDSWNLF